MTDLEDFNFDKIHALTGTDQAAVDHFTQLFITHTLGNDWVALNKAAKEDNASDLKELAHKMKASLDLYNMRRASVLIREIEKKSTAPSSCKNELDELNLLLSRIEQKMGDLLQG